MQYQNLDSSINKKITKNINTTDYRLLIKPSIISDSSSVYNDCKIDLCDRETGRFIYNTYIRDSIFLDSLGNNNKYRLIISKLNYLSDTLDFDTNEFNKTHNFQRKINLKLKSRLEIYVFNALDKTAMNGARVEMREAGTGKLIASENLTGNQFTYSNLEFGKSYWLYGSKETYTSDSILIKIDSSNNPIENIFTKSLYLEPFKMNLPIALYFDNDSPNPNTVDTFTYLDYGETFLSYKKKQNNYIEKSNNLNNNKINQFFKSTLDSNYKNLLGFTKQLQRYLTSGESFEIVVEGYASPLAENEYNRRLTSRRINTLINHLYEFDGGVLRPYLISKALTIRILPFGEEKSDKTVSDNPKDPLNSIYSYDAIEERKIEIKEINPMDKANSLGLFQNPQLGDLWNTQNYSQALGAHAAELFNEDDSRRWTAKGSESNPTSTIIEKNAKNLTSKQRHEVVMMDVYTGDVIEKGGSIEVYNENKKITQAKNKGDFYLYDIQLGQDLTAKIGAAGYNSYSMKHFSSNTEGGVVIRDTVYLTPFSNLPLSLYFDNGQPLTNTNKDEKIVGYDKNFRDYYLKKNDFINYFNQTLKKDESAPSVNNEMITFFENDVKGGYENLKGLSNVIDIYLEKGYELEIIVEGYASSIGSSHFNENLTNRRIQSIVYFFTSYSETIRNAYNNKKLKIGYRPLGDIYASSNNYDIKNKNSSIYSIEASRDRKVVIKDILIRNNGLYKE